MNPNRFDQISGFFNGRRLSRREALTRGAGLAAGAGALTGLNAASAQDATPTAGATPEMVTLPPNDDEVTHLFVQSFQSGSIAPATGAFGTHTVTLEQGMGQTIYFADRPSRDVGVAPTPAFLDGLGFDDDNPPNAALLVDAGDGTTDIAVVELFNPTYDEATHTATYDIAVLANWQNDLELGFQEAPTDLSDLSDNFGAAHLFIDSCGTRDVGCLKAGGDPNNVEDFAGFFEHQPLCFWFSEFSCQVCTPDDASNRRPYWRRMCNETFPACNDQCETFL